MALEFERYGVKIEFTDRVVGALPKNPEIIAAWVNSRIEDQEKAKSMTKKIAKEVDADAEAEKKWVSFKIDSKGIYLDDRNFKAMLREAANTIRVFSKEGGYGKRQLFQHGLFVEPARIYFMKDGKILKQPDGQQERTIHVMTAMGKRDTIKREDFIDQAQMEFVVKIVVPYGLKNAPIGKAELTDMLELSSDIGLGGSRSQSFGKFKILSVQEIKEKQKK